MAVIKLLPEGVWSRIAAGEVVERPASAVKEMVENSLDAGAKRIRVRLWDGGRVRIVVEDDGCGIEFDELPLALAPHATSKIGSIEDLEAIRTLGYRGEALASLAAVAKIEIRSRGKNGGGGVIRAYEGRVADHVKTNCTPGTRVQADEIFANLPARRKFLKSASGELRRVAALLREYAICRPEVAFALEHDGRPVFSTDGGGDRRRAIEQLWGSEPKIQNVEASAGRIKLECWWQPRPGIAANKGMGSRNEIASFVNGRSVSDPVIKGAVGAAARELAGGWALLFSVDPSLVDVNIHPAKAEIRFRYPGEVFEAVREAASKLGAPASLATASLAPVNRSLVSPAPVRQDRGGWNFGADFRSAGDSVGPSPKADNAYKSAPFQARGSENEVIRSGSHFTRVEVPEFDFEDCGEIAEKDREEHDGREEFNEVAFLGQLASGYLIFDSPDGLSVVDPHAAHERVAYERIKAAAGEIGKKDRSQLLLMPSPVPPTLQLEVEERREFLESLGFAFETADGGMRLTAVPYLAGLTGLAKATVSQDALLRGSIAALREVEDDRAGLMKLLWRDWATMACREAVKVTTRLMPEEGLTLWNDLHGCEQPFFCPHGRPTILRLSAADLRKHFDRE